MLKNYFLTAWRNIRRNSFYSLLNIAGLAMGLAVGILILLWVKDELSFDSFHKQAEHIYRINSHLGTGAEAQVWTEAPGPLAVFARNSIPEVAKAVRVINRGDKYLVTYGAKTFLESNTVFADPDFFSVFDFPLLEGKRAHPFTDDHSIVITQSIAGKYFGNADPMGKVLVFDKKGNFTVTGVIADFPANSAINYDIIFPNQAVKRNIKRFPEDFMFRLKVSEWEAIRLQFVTASNTDISLRSQNVILKDARGQHRKYMPCAFTEQGVAMLSGVLNSEKAINMNISIMRAFVEIRIIMFRQLDLKVQLKEIKDRLGEHDVQLSQIYDAMENLLDEKAAERKWEERERIAFKK
jgi:hypothetical protein